MRNLHPLRPLLSGALLLLFTGCATSWPPAPPPRPARRVSSLPEIDRARTLFERGRYADAIVLASEVARLDPLAPGLPELQAAIMGRLAEERRQSHLQREAHTQTRMMDDVLGRNVLPETYQLRRNIRGETTPLRTAPSRMQEALARDVTVHLENVDLAAFAAQIAATEGLNIIADGDLGDATVTIHAEDTPLIEILDYVGRNLGVTFSVGTNLIWATPSQDTQGALPLETRVYRLRKGLAGNELERPEGGGGEGPSMIEAIERFVPQPDGSDLLYNSKAHVLVARNTRANLMLAEDIISALDITPPQVQIEARFISTTVDDLSELGVDWILDSPYVLSRKAGMVEGRPSLMTRSRINATAPEALLGFGAFPGGAQGLNFTYQGVLTDPQFRAIVHVLEASGKARTLSVPRVTTINNRPAVIRVGEDFRYYEEYDVEDVRSSTTAEGTDRYESRLVPVGRPTLEELGIELSATPSVGADLASINLALIPEISDFVRWEYFATSAESRRDNGNGEIPGDEVAGSGGVIKLPVFRRSRIETEVVVRSGETVVMGGLISTQSNTRRQGVPILSHIPFLGQLFRHDIVEEARQNLIIFVTATLISEVGEELIPLDELREELNRLHDGVGASPAPGVQQREPADASAPPDAPLLAPPDAPAPAPAPAPEPAPEPEPEADAPAPAPEADADAPAVVPEDEPADAAANP